MCLVVMFVCCCRYSVSFQVKNSLFVFQFTFRSSSWVSSVTSCYQTNSLLLWMPRLFELVDLVDLDLSYNSLHCLSRDIAKLVYESVLHVVAMLYTVSRMSFCRSLRRLNVEGNQLSGLPYPAAALSLTHLFTGDNLMHPLLWRENTRNQPQVSPYYCCCTDPSVVLCHLYACTGSAWLVLCSNSATSSRPTASWCGYPMLV